MKHVDHDHKRFLHPGDFYFSDGSEHIHTLLGSCIAIVLWHPTRQIGGMCHFVLPKRNALMIPAKMDGRYAPEAMELFRREMSARGTGFSEYQAKIFGGSNMLDALNSSEEDSIGMRNAEMAFNLLTEAGSEILVAHVGETGHRRVVFDVESGDVWVRHEAGDGHRMNSMSGTQ